MASFVGHKNLGNTCYINSVLQCLGAVPALRAALGNSNHRSVCTREDFCAACETESHFEAVTQAIESSMPGQQPAKVEPKRIAGMVPELNEDFQLWQQEDAHGGWVDCLCVPYFFRLLGV
jgi:ubiquitin C-terminal hydrolase